MPNQQPVPLANKNDGASVTTLWRKQSSTNSNTNAGCENDGSEMMTIRLFPLYNTIRLGLSARLKFEISQPFFGLKEPDGSEINIQETFSPKHPFFVTVLYRFVMLVWISVTVILDYKHCSVDDKHCGILFWGYLSQWGMVLAIIYSLLSLATCFGGQSLLRQPTTSGNNPRAMLMATWAAFSCVATVEAVVVLLFWVFNYDDYDGIKFEYFDLMEHGVVAILVIVDGLILGKVPIRAKHVCIPITFAFLFSSWLALDYYSGWRKNSYTPLYSAIDWQKEPIQAGARSFLFVFFVNPLLFLLCWSMSFLRRLLEDFAKDDCSSSTLNDIKGNTAKDDITSPLLFECGDKLML